MCFDLTGLTQIQTQWHPIIVKSGASMGDRLLSVHKAAGPHANIFDGNLIN